MKLRGGKENLWALSSAIIEFLAQNNIAQTAGLFLITISASFGC